MKDNTTLQIQNAVTVYLKSKQLLPFDLARQKNWTLSAPTYRIKPEELRGF